MSVLHATPPPGPTFPHIQSSKSGLVERTVHHVDDYDSPEAVGSQWFETFSAVLQSGDTAAIASLFLEDAYWRDLLTLSWEHHTIYKIPSITAFLDGKLKNTGFYNVSLEGIPTLVKASEDLTWIQCFFAFETAVARGRGFFRLMEDPMGEWKVKSMYTGIEELKGFEEKSGKTRPSGVNHGENAQRQAWKDQRASKREFSNEDPTVLVIGAGQSGLTIAARLGQLGVDTLVIDKNERVGDNWRKRYNFLVLHDPVWYDHLPYVPFPDHWPIFTPKDKLGDWFEAYAATMELNIWMQSTLTSSTYDSASSLWAVNISRKGHPDRIMKPKYLILATGHSGEPNIPVFKGQEGFKGHVCHSSQYTTGGDFTGKKAVVVGCCNSGHDIAQDFYEQGADVTIVQRSSTYVMSSHHGLGVLFRGLYEEGGPKTEDADVIFTSIPVLMFKKIHKIATDEIARLDSDLLKGLERVGFKLDYGVNGSGFLLKYYTRGGGYYLDVGASQLIIDQKIKLKQGHEISYLTDDSIVFDDGKEIKADVVVLATGYQNMKTTAVKIIGKEAECLGEFWGLNQEAELMNMWTHTEHPGIFAMGGNLAHVRFWSKRLALLIKAQEEGLAPKRTKA